MTAGIIKPVLYEAFRHFYRLACDSSYRRYHWLAARYGRKPRFKRQVIKTDGWSLAVPDAASFLSAYREIFVEKIYEFPKERSPVILDCGANIGLSVLFFKSLYPDAKVTAFEADPAIFQILQQNIANNHISDVELINKAVWSSDTTLHFSVEGGDAGRVAVAGDGNIVDIPAVSLASILSKQHFDFIKIDIEGAEVEALRDCYDLLAPSKYIFVEFHSFVNKSQGLGELVAAFEKRGFRVHAHPPFTAKRPFCGIRPFYGMDMQLNLFFWKDRHADA